MRHLVIVFCLCCVQLFYVQAQSSFSIKNQDQTAKPVSLELFGSFYELGFGRSDLLWGELLFNRDFELERPLGEKNPWLVYSREKKEKEDWWHSGYEETKWYIESQHKRGYAIPIVHNNYWPSAHGKYYVQVDNREEKQSVWFAQNRIYLRKGQTYNFSGLFSNTIFFSADKLGKEVVLNLCLFEGDKLSTCLSKKEIKVCTNQFGRIEAELESMEYEGWGTFAMEIPAGTKVAFDFLSLTAADDVKGWKKEAVEKIKQDLKPKTIRFPGGCFASLYDWRDGVGPCEERPVNYDSWWECEFVNDVGTQEFVELCELLEAKPFFCVPVMFNDAFNAAEWVDFCNNPRNERRIAYGRKEPLHVKYWELENEPYRRFDAITFANRCVEFSKQMKKVDPTIKIAVGNYWCYNKKFKEMLEILGPHIDLITNRGGSVEEMHNDLLILDEYNKKHGIDILLCHTEFRAPLSRADGDVDGLNQVQTADPETLFNRSVRWEYAMNMAEQYILFQKMGGDFFTANFTNLTDGWGESLINIAKEKSYLSASGVTYSLLNSLDIVYPQVIKPIKEDKDVVIQVAWNQNRSKLTVVLLNFNEKENVCQLDLKDIQKRFLSEGNLFLLNPGSSHCFNTVSNPERVKVEMRKIKINKKMTVKLFPMSLQVIEIMVSDK